MLQKITLSILLVALMLNITLSQNPVNVKYTTDDGLPHQTVFKIFQASNGYIWFATGLGVSRFDGYSFKNFDKQDSLSSNIIVDIFEDKDNKLWFVGEDNSLSYYSNNHFKRYIFNNSIKQKIQIKHPTKIDIQSDGVSYFFNNIIYKINSLGRITKNKVNNLETWKSIKISNKTYYYYHNILILENSSQKLDTFTLSFNIADIATNKYNDIIIGTERDGLYIYKNSNLSDTPKRLLQKVNITSVFIDIEDGTWISTSSSGVYYYPALYNMSFDNYKFHHRKIKTATVNNKGTITLYSNGVIKYYYNNPNSDKIIILPDYSETQDLYYDEKTEQSIVLTNKSVFSIDNNYKINKIFNLEKRINPIYNVRDNEITIDTKGNYWICNNNKLICFDNKSVIKEINLQSFDDRINTFSINKQSIFLGSESGLWEYKDDKFLYWGDKNELYKLEVISILYNSDIMVLGTVSSGIIINRLDTVYKFDIIDGLISNIVNHVTLNNNILWVSSNRGVSKIYLKIPYDENDLETYTKISGLVSNKIKRTLIRDSMIYIVSDNGINKFNFKKYQINKHKPFLLIKNIRTNNSDKIKKEYNLDYNNSSFVVSYVGINFKSMSDVKYFHKLVGLDEYWQKTDKTSIIYHSLPPGKYILKLEAQSTSGVFSNTAEIIINVSKPYWQTWTFIVIVFILTITVLGLIFSTKARIKRNKIQKEIDLLQYQALNKQMNPHFIFNSLNSIHNYILQNDVINSSKFLNKFSMLIRMILNNSQHQLVSIKKDIEALAIYIELESNRFKDRFKFNIDVEDDIDIYSHKIPPLIIQPFVENAIWHGLMNRDKDFDGRIDINFTLQNKRIICTITDNGIGRIKADELNESKQQNESLGTKITSDRKDLINALHDANIEIKYIDLYDDNNEAKGTTVVIDFPVFV